MTQKQAEQLAQAIREQFEHVETLVLPSAGRAQQWFIGVRRRGVSPESQSLIVYSDQEWQDALLALEILSK